MRCKNEVSPRVRRPSREAQGIVVACPAGAGWAAGVVTVNGRLVELFWNAISPTRARPRVHFLQAATDR